MDLAGCFCKHEGAIWFMAGSVINLFRRDLLLKVQYVRISEPHFSFGLAVIRADLPREGPCVTRQPIALLVRRIFDSGLMQSLHSRYCSRHGETLSKSMSTTVHNVGGELGFKVGRTGIQFMPYPPLPGSRLHTYPTPSLVPTPPTLCCVEQMSQTRPQFSLFFPLGGTVATFSLESDPNWCHAHTIAGNKERQGHMTFCDCRSSTPN